MPRIHARSIVAVVAHLEVIRDIADKNFVGGSVSILGEPAHIEYAIARRAFSGLPRPTCVMTAGTIDFLKEAAGNCKAHARHYSGVAI
jgi:hypothetical protein